MRKCIAEMLGTFVLVFMGTGAIVIDRVSHGAIGHVGIALTFGLIVMAMINALGETSGAHLNPAVTLGFWIAGKFPTQDLPKYIASQLLGAFAASGMLLLLFGNEANLGATLPAGTWMQSFVLEFLLTGLLMLVILCVSTGSKELGILAGVTIGGVITFECLFAGPISGASMNPARSLAPALVSGHFESLWIYVVATIAGSAAAIPVWSCIRASPANEKAG